MKEKQEFGSGTGLFVVDMESDEVLYLSDGMRKICPDMRVGEPCYRGFGMTGRCGFCPLKRLGGDRINISLRDVPGFESGADVVAIPLPPGRALLCYGHISLTESHQWMGEKHGRKLRKGSHIISFEMDPETKVEHVASTAAEELAGNYDGRNFSDILLEDGVIHPKDAEALRQFRDHVGEPNASREIVLRLMSREGTYRWYKISLCFFTSDTAGHRTMIDGAFTDVDEETHLREWLNRQSEYDATTGIYNKAAFYSETALILREDPDIGHNIIRFDIDRFKVVNELFGTDEGDRVLRYVGGIITQFLHEGESYAHMGEDVFCMCVRRSDKETEILLEEIRAMINQYPIEFNFVLSAGIFRLPHYNGQPVSILCDRAALAQKKVKGSYIPWYTFYDDSMGEALSKEHYIIVSMRKALENGQFFIRLQPKCDMRTNRILGAEALARWRHPKDGIIQPGEFIPLFERNGFITQLDEYIWDLTCQTLRGWLDRGFEPIPLSVNVSRAHLQDPRFCDKILRLVRKYRLEPRLLELEITESAYTDNPRTLFTIMDRLQGQGFSFLMDDFGSGYSSLNMLKDIPVDQLKIDLNFLSESRRSSDAGRIILETTIDMARRLDLPVIVEGVETKEQVEFLLGAGCTVAQGYYFSRPIETEELERRLEEERRAGESVLDSGTPLS